MTGVKMSADGAFYARQFCAESANSRSSWHVRQHKAEGGGKARRQGQVAAMGVGDLAREAEADAGAIRLGGLERANRRAASAGGRPAPLSLISIAMPSPSRAIASPTRGSPRADRHQPRPGRGGRPRAARLRAEYGFSLRTTLDILIADETPRGAQLALARNGSGVLIAQASPLRETGALDRSSYRVTTVP